MSLLSEKLAPLWAAINRLQARQMSIFPATVTSVSPVRIRIDGESQPLAATPDVGVPVDTGARVRVLRYGTTHLIISRIGGAGVVQAGWSDLPGGSLGVNETRTVDVTFDPLPASTPRAIMITPTGSNRLIIRALMPTISRTGFSAQARNVSTGSTADGSFYWAAIR